MNNVYAQKVELLLRLIPIITDEGVFAVHGGSAINLFLKDLPRRTQPYTVAGAGCSGWKSRNSFIVSQVVFGSV